MPCPQCGDVCTCASNRRAVQPAVSAALCPPTKPKFEIDSADAAAVLIDPEAYDASEQEFAVSLEQASSRPKFVVEADAPTERTSSRQTATEIPVLPPEVQPVSADALEQPSLLMDESAEAPPTAWRKEVAARLNHYRARRIPKEPKFPSLRLKFESARLDSESTRHVVPEPIPQAVLIQQMIPAEEILSPASMKSEPARPKIAEFLESSARILEFPRSNMGPVRRADELAEPMIDRPRILEVPDVAPPAPALGGIHIGPSERAEEVKSDFEVPLQAALISRRAVATALDATVIGGAVGLFAYIFRGLTKSIPPTSQELVAASVLFALFWSAYHFLLLPLCGTTVGLQATRLQLRHFDGKAVKRRIRKWRAVAAVLSAVSVGLGYAWCLLDEDQLCWHDRITRTYVSPRD